MKEFAAKFSYKAAPDEVSGRLAFSTSTLAGSGWSL